MRDPIATDVMTRVTAHLDNLVDILFQRDFAWHPLRSHIQTVAPPANSTWPLRDIFVQRYVHGRFPRDVELKIEAALPTSPFPTERGLLSLLTIADTFYERVVAGPPDALYDNPVIDRNYAHDISLDRFALQPNGRYRISYQDAVDLMDLPRPRLRRLYDNLFKSIEALSVPIAMYGWHAGDTTNPNPSVTAPSNGDISTFIDTHLSSWMIEVADEIDAIYTSHLRVHEALFYLLRRDLAAELVARATQPTSQQLLQLNQAEARWQSARIAAEAAANMPPMTGPGWWSWRPQVTEFYCCASDPRIRVDQFTMLQKFNLVARVSGIFEPNQSSVSSSLVGDIYNLTRQQHASVDLTHYGDGTMSATIGGVSHIAAERYFVSRDLVFNHPQSPVNTSVIDIAGLPGETIQFSVENLPTESLAIVEGDEEIEPQPYFVPDRIQNLVFRPIDPVTSFPSQPNQIFTIRYDPQAGQMSHSIQIYLGDDQGPLDGIDIIWTIFSGTNRLFSFHTLTDAQGIAEFDFSWDGEQHFLPSVGFVPVADRPLGDGAYAIFAMPAEPILTSFIAREIQFVANLVAPTVLDFTTAAPLVSDRERQKVVLGETPILVRARLGRRHRVSVLTDRFTATVSSRPSPTGSAPFDSIDVTMERDPSDPNRFFSMPVIYPNAGLLTAALSRDISIPDQGRLTASMQMSTDPSPVTGDAKYIDDGPDPIDPNQADIPANVRYQAQILESALHEIDVGVHVARQEYDEVEEVIIEHKKEMLENAKRFLYMQYAPHDFSNRTLLYRNFIVSEYLRVLQQDNALLYRAPRADLVNAAAIPLTDVYPATPSINFFDQAEIGIINRANDFFRFDVTRDILREIHGFLVAGLTMVGEALVQMVVPYDAVNAIVWNKSADGFQATFVEKAIGIFDILPFIPNMSVFRPAGAVPRPGRSNFTMLRIGQAARELDRKAVHTFLDMVHNPTLRRAYATNSADRLTDILEQAFVTRAEDALVGRLATNSAARNSLENSLIYTLDRIENFGSRMRVEMEELERMRTAIDNARREWNALPLDRRTPQKARDIFGGKRRKFIRKSRRIRNMETKFFRFMLERERQFARSLGRARGATLPDSVALQIHNSGGVIKSHDKVRGLYAWRHYELDCLEAINSTAIHPYSGQVSVHLETTYIGRFPESFVTSDSVDFKPKMLIRPDAANSVHDMIEVKYYFFNELGNDTVAIDKRGNMLFESIQKGRKAQFARLRPTMPGAPMLDVWDEVYRKRFTVYTPEPVPIRLITEWENLDPAFRLIEWRVLAPRVDVWVTR